MSDDDQRDYHHVQGLKQLRSTSIVLKISLSKPEQNYIEHKIKLEKLKSLTSTESGQ